MTTKKILIVGGGAAGLPLATRLGNKLGKHKRAEITLVDPQHSHIWKPRFHELATGIMDADLDALDYRLHGVRNHYHFEQGAMSALARDKKHIVLRPLLDKRGIEILPERQLDYDYLVIALGSRTNDFGVKGVHDHCYCLDSRQQAERFRSAFINQCLHADYYNQPLTIAIVGGGPTGVELSAELLSAVDNLKRYGLRHLQRHHLNVHIIEAAPHLLNGLPERVSIATKKELAKLGVIIHTDTQITAVDKHAFTTATGETIKADLLVWAAGVLAPPMLSELAGLETNRINQLLVNESLQTTNDPAIFALGDCATMTSEHSAPPTAQAAQQMAEHTAHTLQRLLAGDTAQAFRFDSRGVLISLANYDSVGSLRTLLGGHVFIEGWLAKRAYISTYRIHQAKLFGWPRTLLLLLAGSFSRLARPGLKLHL
jgi:NADH dehydrogenase